MPTVKEIGPVSDIWANVSIIPEVRFWTLKPFPFNQD